MSENNAKKPALMPKDEKKQQDKDKKDKEDIINTIEVFTDMVLNFPERFIDPKLDFFRRFVYTVSRDPVTFPLPFSNGEEHSVASKPPSLTDGVAKKLKNRENFEKDEFLVLMIGDFEFKTKRATAKDPITNTEIVGEKIIVTAWSKDGDNNFVLLQFDYILSSKMHDTLKTGSVIRITNYVPVYFDYHNTDDLCVAILIRNFELIHQKMVDENFIGRPDEDERHALLPMRNAAINNNTTTGIMDMNIDHIILNNSTSNGTLVDHGDDISNTNDNSSALVNSGDDNSNLKYNNNNNSVINNINSGDDSINRNDNNSTLLNNNDDMGNINYNNNNNIINNNLMVNRDNANDVINDGNIIPCNGENCSKYGVHFEQCVVSIIPVNSIVLHEAARECFFVTVDVHEMDNNWKRNILYYWYATNVYLIGGKDNRQDLPECVVNSIRNLYPEDNVEDYKTDGHATKKQRH